MDDTILAVIMVSEKQQLKLHQLESINSQTIFIVLLMLAFVFLSEHLLLEHILELFGQKHECDFDKTCHKFATLRIWLRLGRN